MTRNLKILVSLLLLSAALAISGAVGHAATYIAQFVYGVRYDKQALKPSNCTTGRVCDWVDTNGKKHFWNGTADQTFPLVTPTAKGDIIAYTGTAWDKKAVGTNGYCLKADSTQTTGLVWASCGGGGSGSLQNAYDNSSNPVTITEDNTLGALFIKANSNGDSPLGIKNNAGSLVAHFDADGALETRYLYTTSTATDALQFEAATANSSTNNAFQFNNTTNLTGSTTLATFGSNGVVKMSIFNDGSYIGPKAGTSSSALHAYPTGTGDLVSTDAPQTITGKTIERERFSSGTATIAATGTQDIYSITPPGGVNNLSLFCDFGWYYSSGGDQMSALGFAVTYRKVAGTWTKIGTDGTNTGYVSQSYGVQAHGPAKSQE